jgi:hypothetical protein
MKRKERGGANREGMTTDHVHLQNPYEISISPKPSKQVPPSPFIRLGENSGQVASGEGGPSFWLSSENTKVVFVA